MLELRSLPDNCAHRRRAFACLSCDARVFSVCGSLEPEDLARLDALAERTTYAVGDGLVRQGDEARHLFNISSGSVRVHKLLADGRRQITGFLFAGDFLGLATGDRYAFSVEAVEATTVCRFSKLEYQALIREQPALEAALLQRASHELEAAQNQILLLGRKTARERLATFLLDLPDLDPLRPSAKGQVRLPMSRTEIADYLGVTIETVSREFTRLKTLGLIEMLSPKAVRIIEPDRLRALSEGAA